jgi:hypothetical protein
MKGIQFVIDDKGKKKAVLIDLSEHGELWEDFYDVLISQQRKDEPAVPWDELKAEMKEGKGGWLSCGVCFFRSKRIPLPAFGNKAARRLVNRRTSTEPSAGRYQKIARAWKFISCQDWFIPSHLWDWRSEETHSNNQNPSSARGISKSLKRAWLIYFSTLRRDTILAIPSSYRQTVSARKATSLLSILDRRLDLLGLQRPPPLARIVAAYNEVRYGGRLLEPGDYRTLVQKIRLLD